MGQEGWHIFTPQTLLVDLVLWNFLISKIVYHIVSIGLKLWCFTNICSLYDKRTLTLPLPVLTLIIYTPNRIFYYIKSSPDYKWWIAMEIISLVETYTNILYEKMSCFSINYIHYMAFTDKRFKYCFFKYITV